MRSLFVYGLVALYLVAAFVPPDSAVVPAEAKVPSLHLPLPKSVTHVFDQARTSKLVAAVKGLSSLIPADVPGTVKDAAKKQATVALNAVAEQSLDRLISREKQEFIKDQLTLIQWAGRKSDARACRDFRDVSGDASTGTAPSAGDFLAYCLARTTREPSRCTQIQPDTSPPLKTLCESEFL